MSFKGTGKRTRTDLEKQVENMGGHLNAYTSREQTVFYAKVVQKDVPQAMDILADILTNSQYSEHNINNERDVILREMREVDSNNEEHIFDRLHETAYRGTMLGRTILGPAENIESINRAQILDYTSTFYVAPRMVVAGAGAVKHDELVALSEKLLGSVPNKGKREPVLEPAKFTGSDIRVRIDDMPQAHIALAFATAGWNDPDNYPLMICGALLGSWNRALSGGKHSSSELVAAVAANDLAHSVSAFNTQYSDTGLFGVYAVAEDNTQDELMYEITRAITSLCYQVDET